MDFLATPLIGFIDAPHSNETGSVSQAINSDHYVSLAFQLHALAIAVAASCTERELIQFGGRVGSTLYALSREPSARSAPSSSYGSRKPITLSTKPLSTFKPIEDVLDDEDLEAVTA